MNTTVQERVVVMFSVILLRKPELTGVYSIYDSTSSGNTAGDNTAANNVESIESHCYNLEVVTAVIVQLVFWVRKQHSSIGIY